MGVSADLLRSSALFRRLAPADLERVGAIAGAKTYEKGDTIFFEGDPPHLLYTVVSGRVKVVKGVPQSGREVILEIFGPGDPVGAVVAYEDHPYPASAIALERTLCLRVPRADFFDLLARHPSVVRGFLSGMAQRILELTRRIAEVSGGRVETRFALLFLKLAEKLGRSEGLEAVIPLPLTRQDLADLTGTTVETAIRVMSRWAKEGVVVTEADGFRVKSRPALERLARG